MKHMFSDAGKAALRTAMARRCLLAFDFDGTLAPIVPLPESAHTPTGIARRLAVLATLCPVAVITGRAVDDVRRRLGFSPTYILGNHGAEGWADLDPARQSRQLDGLRATLRARQAALGALGVRVEDKRLSLALHYRSAPERARALAFIDRLLADFVPPLKAFGGKCVVNVVVADAPHKGEALTALAQRTEAEAVVFIGDDLNDEAAFEIAPSHWLTVRVGDAGADSAARYFIESHAHIAHLLQDMIDLRAAP